MTMIFVLTLICMSVGFLNAQEANVDKDEQAILELLRLPKSSLSEEQIIEIAEKYMISDRHEKAYEFLKNYVPKDKTVIYDYVFAFVARKAKAEGVEKIFYALLDKKEEFGTVEIEHFIFGNHEYAKYFPMIFKKVDDFRQDLWHYSRYHTRSSVIISRYLGAKPHTIIKPTNLNQLHNFAIAHLGDFYRAESETKKAEILKELNDRNIEHAELLLLMGNHNADNDAIYKDFFLKYPKNLELKVLYESKRRTLFNNTDETLLPLIDEVKGENKKLALWLYFNYAMHLKEVKQDALTGLDSLMKDLKVPENLRFNMYGKIFINANDRHKIISDDLIEKYRPIVLVLLDKCVKKNVNGDHIYSLIPLLAKLKAPEGCAKAINKQLASNKFPSRSYYPQFRVPKRIMASSIAPLSDYTEFPFIAYKQISNLYHELYSATGKNRHVDDEFRKKIVPLIENKYLKLSIYHFLNNEEEIKKIIKDLEKNKSCNGLQIVASYHGFKYEYKEAVMALKKALVLARTDSDKNAINKKIISYAVKADDPTTKADGVSASKRLKDFDLSKKELLELSMHLESLGEPAKAKQLDDQISKMSSVTKESHNSHSLTIQALRAKLENMLRDEKDEDSFTFLIDSLKIHFVRFSDLAKGNHRFSFDLFSFNVLMDMIKKKIVPNEFKKFVSEQKSLADDELVTIAFILYQLNELEEATLIAKKLIEKKPKDLTYKMFAYAINLKNTKELNDDLKKAINDNVVDTLFVVQNFWVGQWLFEDSYFELKELLFYILDNTTIEEKGVGLYTKVFIDPFLTHTRLSRYLTAEPIFRAKRNRMLKTGRGHSAFQEYYDFCEDLMLKCIKNKMLASVAGSALFDYYESNEMPLDHELIQAFSEVMDVSGKTNQNFYTYNGDSEKSLLPLHISLAIYLLNQNKVAELDAICEKLADDEKTQYKKIIEKLKIFYAEKPITKEDLIELSASVGVNANDPKVVLLVLVQILPKANVNNRYVHEFLLNTLKEHFSQEDKIASVNTSELSKYFGNQFRKLKEDEAVSYLLDLEKSVFSKPFDKNVFVISKDEWNHYTKRILRMFNFDHGDDFDIGLYKHMLKASEKSAFYSYLTRDNNRYYESLRRLSLEKILDLGLVSGNLSEMQILKFDKRKFLIDEVIRKIRRDKKHNGAILSKMEQTDGVKLLSYWLEGKPYHEIFDFFGSKLSEFNALSITQKEEWVDFLAFFYEREIEEKKPLNDLGKEFQTAIDSFMDSRLEKVRKKFLEEKYDDNMNYRQFLTLIPEVYPSFLPETEERFLGIMKFVREKYDYYARNWPKFYIEDYQDDNLLSMIIGVDSPKRNHLVIVTKFLGRHSKWSTGYYRRYSSIVSDYMLEQVFKKLEKLDIKPDKHRRYVLNEEQKKAFKIELNAIIDDVMMINNNSVPFYEIFFRQELQSIVDSYKILKELVDEWGTEKELSGFKRDFYFDVKSSVESNKDILKNHYLSIITDPKTIPQIKLIYIYKFNISELSEEKQQIVLNQYINVIHSLDANFMVSPSRLYSLIKDYDYKVLENSSEEISKLIKNWYRGFEKALLENYEKESDLYDYSFSRISNLEELQKIIKVMKEYLREDKIFRFFNTPELGFRVHFPAYMMFIKEGLDSVVLDALNGDVEKIDINLKEISNQFLVAEDLEAIKKLTEKITDPERKKFAKILFYRIGITNANETKSLRLFVSSLKEMIKEPIKDEKVKRVLLNLLSGTALDSDEEVTKALGRK